MPIPVYVDCFSGASGDMLLGALLDAGVDVERLRAALETLPVHGWSLDVRSARQHGLGGSRAHVSQTVADQPHRGLADIVRIIRAGHLPDGVAERAVAVFTRL